LFKMQHFNLDFDEDVYLDLEKFWLLKSSLARLNRLQETVGHGNFHILGLDEALRFARNYDAIGAFTRDELDFLEMIFYEDSVPYGFFGEKPFRNITDHISKHDVAYVPGTGNFLYKGKPSETYGKIKKELGPRAILTSGVRSVMKQFLLFLNKAYQTRGNLSRASRSLAPPGYSFHSIGDFDMGQVGLGAANFTERFTATSVFRELRDRGYLQLRYPRNNMLGVRFEPWHIRVV
ncbi:MAG: M15 family metallopeptidase, partial [bacterium]|nr:M15 family metallopeptidase [bacterium]